MAWLIGVDVGGTFTDVIAHGTDGAFLSAKVPSLPGLCTMICGLMRRAIFAVRWRDMSART